MEGPSVRAVADKLADFKRKKVISATGNARIEKKNIEGKKIRDIFSIGKNLFIKFSDFSLKIHFLMFGNYRINEAREDAEPRLSLNFEDEMLNFYNLAVKIISNHEVETLYDEEIDITSESWNADKVFRLTSEMKEELICDILLDQNIFAGVGNIIKNEALYRAKTHPLSMVGKIPEEKLKEIISKTREYSLQFYEAKKKGQKINTINKVYKKKEMQTNKGKGSNEKNWKKK